MRPSFLLQLPYYIDGDTKITESSAILRYIARKHGLYGKTIEEKTKIDVATGVITDAAMGLGGLLFNPDFVSIISNSNFKHYRPMNHLKVLLIPEYVSDVGQTNLHLMMSEQRLHRCMRIHRCYFIKFDIPTVQA